MKTTLLKNTTTLLTVLLFSCSSLLAQDTGKEIVSCIENGDADKLAENFHSSIDLEMPDNDGTYSKTQARQIMKSFFSKNPPEKFTINHEGSSNDGSKYWIGTYRSNGNNFRTYCLAKKISGKFVIQQLQFEKE